MDKMPSKFYVVKFLTLPRPDVAQYVCVPDTWLMWIDKPSSIAAVAYPEGNPADIEELARNNRSNSFYWLAYKASVKYVTSSFDNAMDYIRVRKELDHYENVSDKPVDQKPISGDEQELSKPQPTLTTSSSGANHVKNEAYKRPSLASPYARTPTGQARPQEKMKSPAGAAERPRVSGSQNPVHDDRPSRSLQASLESRSTNVSQETSRSSPMHDVQATRGVSHDCQRPGTSSDHACCITKFEAAFGSVQADIHKLASELNRWARINNQNVDKFVEIDAWMKAYEMWKTEITSPSKETLSTGEITRQINDKIAHIKNDVDNYGKVKKLPRKKTDEFTLPPEYSPIDSRWTLRRPNPGPTLTELLPRSRIYIDIQKLDHCCMTARDCKSLARLLMMEVFSDNALKVCSYTGAQCPFYNRKNWVRPGLDENARNVLVGYVEKYGRQRGWLVEDPRAINKTMQTKLHECRRRSKNRK